MTSDQDRREQDRRARTRWCSGRRLEDLVAHFLPGAELRCPGTVHSQAVGYAVCGSYLGEALPGTHTVVRMLHINGREWLDGKPMGTLGYRQKCPGCHRRLEVVFSDMSQEAAA